MKMFSKQSALLAGALILTMSVAEARGFRGAVIVRPGFGYPAFGYLGYPGPFAYGYGVGFPINAHPNSGQLKFDTKQKDAQIFIDGAYAGTAKDLKSTWLKEGTYDLEFRAPNGEKFDQQVRVIPGQTIHIKPELPADNHS